jgi:hypothetical protein
MTERRAHYVVQVGNVTYVQFATPDNSSNLLCPDPVPYRVEGPHWRDQPERSPKAGAPTPDAPAASENGVQPEDK